MFYLRVSILLTKSENYGELKIKPLEIKKLTKILEFEIINNLSKVQIQSKKIKFVLISSEIE